MEIKNLHLNDLRNNEHFQFHTETKLLIETIGAQQLKIADNFNQNYLPAYQQLDEALQKITKNSFTEQRSSKDSSRDSSYRGSADTVKAAQNHFDTTVIDAARRLKILFDTYGNVSRLPLNEETAAIYNLVKDIREKYAAEANLIGLMPWIDKLDEDNRDYEALVTSGYEETVALQTEYNAKQARKLLDDAYNNITRRINAYIIIEGESQFADFVRRINIQIDKYNNTLATRRGRSAEKKRKEAEAQANNNDDQTTDDTPTNPQVPPTNPPPRDEE